MPSLNGAGLFRNPINGGAIIKKIPYVIATFFTSSYIALRDHKRTVKHDDDASTYVPRAAER